jgi:hypothetical protein
VERRAAGDQLFRDAAADVAANPKRFHGTVILDTARVGRDASRIADEVIVHLSGPSSVRR